MVSIIIPLHNLGLKGDYCLKRCLDSILAQKYDDFEVLLMENGSSDDTVEVAKSYCQKDNRFKLHILETIGIANARNEGLKIAKGEYVSFIDGDDAISDNFLYAATNTLQDDKDIDFIFTSWAFYYNNKRTIKYIVKHDENKILIPDKYLDHQAACTIWAKLIRKDTLIKNNIFLDDKIFGSDDFLFGNELYFASKKYALCADACYFYTQNRTNQTTKTKLKNITDGSLVLINRLTDLYKKYNVYEENKSILENMYINLFIGSNFAMTSVRKMSFSQIVNLINQEKEKILQINTSILQCQNWQKVWFRRFQNAVAFGGGIGGYIFIKFMRFYRNIILKPLGIKIHKLY